MHNEETDVLTAGIAPLAVREVRIKRPALRQVTRGRVLQWLRTVHLWLGLWGAVAGFLFGLTGFLMNHRAVMKIPIERAETTHAQVVIPQSFASADELVNWLKQRAALPDARSNIKKEPATAVQWRGHVMQQVERWQVNLNTTTVSVSAKYIPGSGVVDIETQDATTWGVLMRLHTGSGASASWVLLADTIAGALMILTLSGVLLWSKLRMPRLLGMTVLIALPTATVIYLGM
jgi:uncharacterized protein